jgi:hypothetical protein
MLGRVASAIGAAGGDIQRVDVLESETGRATDDVFVVVRDSEHLRVVAVELGTVAGVDVCGMQHPAPPSAGHADLELIRQVLAQPARAVRTLVDGAPAALGTDWAAVVSYEPSGDPGDVVAVSPRCPGPDCVTFRSALRLTALSMTPPAAPYPYGGTALVPLGAQPLGLVLVREAGPEFHRSELWRLGQIGDIVATAISLEMSDT